MSDALALAYFARHKNKNNDRLWDSVHPYIRSYERPSDEIHGEIAGFIRDGLEWLGYSRSQKLTPALPTVEEVKSEAAQRSAHIFELWDKLHGILSQHEGTLRKRWLKKSKEQRKKVLLEAWPNMATSHRPDFQALKHEPNLRANTHEVPSRSYINLEDLLKANNLLLLINSRGSHKPDIFAYFDLQTQHLGRKSFSIQPAYLHGYTMLLSNQTSPTTYGQIVPWGHTVEGFLMMMEGVGVQPGEGLLALEIQETLLGFSVKCAENVLHDLLPLQNPTDIPSAL
jgi:hypothetical protein